MTLVDKELSKFNSYFQFGIRGSNKESSKFDWIIKILTPESYEDETKNLGKKKAVENFVCLLCKW